MNSLYFTPFAAVRVGEAFFFFFFSRYKCNRVIFWINNRLDVYIHDYLVKRDLKASAQAFQAEGKVSSDPVGKCFWIYD